MKILFVSNFWDYHYAGAWFLSHSHFEALSNIAGVGGEHVISILSANEEKKPDVRKIVTLCSNTNCFKKLMNYINGKVSSYSNDAENIVTDIVKYGDFDFVWFDCADCFGSTVRKVKRQCPHAKVYVFWHAVPYPETLSGIFRQYGFSSYAAKKLWYSRNVQISRRLSVEYADANIVLNDRDITAFREVYGKNPELILPMCLEDKARPSAEENNPEEFNIIFVGSGFHMPNIDGIKWFAKNVMPNLDKKAVLYIIGNAMDTRKDLPEFAGNDNIRIIGKTDDLSPYYNKADLAVVPIFYGAGMMTKVAEALMHGKNVVAIGHALNGYEGLDECRCDTAEEFAEKINQLIAARPEKYNPAMRKIYEEKYSLNAMENILREFLTSRG